MPSMGGNLAELSPWYVSATRVVAGPHALDEIARALDALWKVHPEVPTDIRIRMQIATAEIGANIIEHAGRGRPVRLTMEAVLVSNAMQVNFTDDGCPGAFDPNAARPARRPKGAAAWRRLFGHCAPCPPTPPRGTTGGRLSANPSDGAALARCA